MNEETEEEFDFSIKGFFENEIIFEFADEESTELYVGRDILVRASSMFQAMLEGSSKEGKERKVKIEDFKMEDFREYLYCIDAGTLKPVTEENVLRIVSIAHKYRSTAVVKKCKNVIKEMMYKYSTEPSILNIHLLDLSNKIHRLKRILEVLVKTVELNFETLTEIGTERMDFFNSNLYSGTCDGGNQQLTECRKLFATLPVDVQNKIHKARALKLEPRGSLH